MDKMTDEQRLLQAAECLSPQLYELILRHSRTLSDDAREIRLRLNQPVSVAGAKGAWFFTRGGDLANDYSLDSRCCSRRELDETFQRMCSYSVYARQRELNQGFLTLKGGHRAGVSGTAVTELGQVVNVRQITSVSIRVARELPNCADSLLKSIDCTRGLLIAGAPCSGKTTLLRDIARQISLKENLKVSVIDERGELAAKSGGEPQNDLGLCDVFDGYPKSVGIGQAVRTMSPDVVVCDEVGTAEDVRALMLCARSGVSVIASVHAGSREDLLRQPRLRSALSTGVFPAVALLSGRSRAGETAALWKDGELLAA